MHDTIVETVIELLCETFPRAFVRYEAKRKPLKVGIYNDLLSRLGGAVTADELSLALRCYTGNAVYRSRLVAGAWRYDLNGDHCGEVSREHGVVGDALARAAGAAARKPPKNPAPRSPGEPAARKIEQPGTARRHALTGRPVLHLPRTGRP